MAFTVITFALGLRLVTLVLKTRLQYAPQYVMMDEKSILRHVMMGRMMARDVMKIVPADCLDGIAQGVDQPLLLNAKSDAGMEKWYLLRKIVMTDMTMTSDANLDAARDSILTTFVIMEAQLFDLYVKNVEILSSILMKSAMMV